MSAQKQDELSHPQYWNERYTNQDGHEWFKDYSSLAPFLDKYLHSNTEKDSRILHLGSGDSTVPMELANRGYRNQICVDFSSVIVDHMSTQEAKASGIIWIEADVRNMTEIQSKSIDVAFDKGTLDAMIYGSPWNPPENVVQNTQSYINEVFRVLKDDGVFLYITFRQPHFIKPLINGKDKWNLGIEVLSDGESTFDYHAFIMKKATAG